MANPDDPNFDNFVRGVMNTSFSSNFAPGDGPDDFDNEDAIIHNNYSPSDESEEESELEGEEESEDKCFANKKVRPNLDEPSASFTSYVLPAEVLVRPTTSTGVLDTLTLTSVPRPKFTDTTGVSQPPPLAPPTQPSIHNATTLTAPTSVASTTPQPAVFTANAHIAKVRRVLAHNVQTTRHRVTSVPVYQWRDVSDLDPGPTHNIQISNVDDGPQLPEMFDSNSEPIEYFNLFFHEGLLQLICKESNLYANEKRRVNTSPHSRLTKWTDLNIIDLQAYLGTILKMGLIPMKNIEDYFSTMWDKRIPFFREIFSKNEFLNIFWNMHFNHGHGREARHKSFLIAPVVEHVQRVAKLFYRPSNTLSIDESTISFKGKVSFKVYNPNKPVKFGLKVYVASDAKNGYIYDFLPYFGNDVIIPNSALLKTTQIVKKLTESVVFRENDEPRSGLHVFIDRYYTSSEIANELLKTNTLVTGTVMANRTGLKALKKKAKPLKKGEIIAFRQENVLVLCWKDKRIVTMLSTFSKGDRTLMTAVPSKWPDQPPTLKPHVILDYIRHMGGVDRSDHFIASYQFMRKTKKWYRKLFFWLLEVSVVNSYIMYKETRLRHQEKPMSHAQFRESLVRSLVAPRVAQQKLTKKPGRQPQVGPAERLQGRHFMSKVPKGGRCVVCLRRNLRKETVYFCKSCTSKPYLHPDDCFEIFHTSKDF